MDIKELDSETLGKFKDYRDHKRVVRFEDPESGFKAFIAIHNANLGPALGGCRIMKYKSEDEAIQDVLRLSRGMTYKNALAGLPLGGGKSVIIADPATEKTEDLLKAMGRAVESMGGDYITAEDSGTTEEDMEVIAQETSYVVGLPPQEGESESLIGGNPSPYTAYGVYSGLKVAVKQHYGESQLSGLKVAVQGVGAVGQELCRLLHEDGVELIVTDVNWNNLGKVKESLDGVMVVEPDKIFGVDANVFSPCALGGQLNDDTIPQMKFDIIAGAANNQLAESRHEALLAEKKITYLPDYVLNAGGVIAACYEYLLQAEKNPFSHDLTRVNMLAHIHAIGATLEKIFRIAEDEGLMMGQAADKLAEDIFLRGEKAGLFFNEEETASGSPGDGMTAAQ